MVRLPVATYLGPMGLGRARHEGSGGSHSKNNGGNSNKNKKGNGSMANRTECNRTAANIRITA